MTEQEIKPNEKHSCINCKHFYESQTNPYQPHPEFACLKGKWDGISNGDEYNSLYKENDCKEFSLV